MPTEAVNSQCPAPTKHVKAAFIDHGIWLGESIVKIRNRLGTPNKAPKLVRYYLYEGKDGQYDISSVLAMKIKRNRVTEIYANHSTTN